MLVAKYGIQPFLDSSQTIVLLLNSRHKLLTGNAAFETLRHGKPDASLLKDFLPDEAQADFNRLSQSVKRSRKPGEGEMVLQSDDQHGGRYRCLLIPLDGGRLLLFAEPISGDQQVMEKYRLLVEKHERVKEELRETQQALEIKQTEVIAVKAQADEVSHVDSLTFLPNRKQIISELQREVNSSERYGTPLSVSMLDLDHFKLVNDTYGHPTGDEVLRFLAAQFRDHIRLPDMIGRYGGEEFLVILPNSTVKAASEQAARLCQHVRSIPIISGRNTLHMTISIGVAQYRIHGDDWRKLIERADQALYQAKNNGRDQWSIIW